VPERIERGLIVVVQWPGDDAMFIRRVIGLPGERIAASGGRVTVGGQPLDEPYLGPGITTEGLQEVWLGPDEYFMLGDNRPDSNDSRFKGPVTRDLLVALVDP
jgi:signal peptidase I